MGFVSSLADEGGHFTLKAQLGSISIQGQGGTGGTQYKVKQPLCRCYSTLNQKRFSTGQLSRCGAEHRHEQWRFPM